MADISIKDFLDAVKRNVGEEKLKRYLLSTDPQTFMSWADDNGLDALHHVIKLNSPEAAQVLLYNGYFLSPHEPSVNPYSHFAALQGLSTILSIILQYRPDDFRLISRDKITVYDNEINHPSNRHVTPLDIAAEQSNIKCVQTILTRCILKLYPEAPSKDDVTLACLADSPSSLKLLLKSKPPVPDIKSGIEVSLRYVKPRCLDILLSCGLDTKSLFKHINFFHVLYTYSAIFGKDGCSLLPQMTEVLIKHGHSAKASKPSRTYPLYSLLSHSFRIFDIGNTKYFIQCMKMLLQAGADPCFDEVKDERGQVKRGIKPAAGRNCFSSALHCLLDTVESVATALESPALAVKFVQDCVEVLCQFNASANQVGVVTGTNSNLRGTVLHQYAKTSVVLGVNDAIMKCTLRYGADPNEKVDGKYAVNTYIDILFEKLADCQIVDPRHKITNDINEMLKVCTFMTPSSVQDCTKIFKKDHSHEISEQVRFYVKYLRTELEERCRVVRPLRRMAAWQVWRMCRMKASLVHSLPVSAKIKTDILPIA